MFGFFKFLMVLGVVAGFAGFFWPQLSGYPAIANAGLPPETPQYLSFGGLGLIVLGLAGRMATRPPESETGEWK